LKRIRFRSPKDIDKLEIIAFDQSQMMIDGLKALGLEVSRSQFPIMTANHLVQWELCKRGVAACIILEEIGDEEPRVARVHRSLPPIPIPIWLVCHRELHTSRRIRIVFDLLAEELAKIRACQATVARARGRSSRSASATRGTRSRGGGRLKASSRLTP